MEYSIDCLQLFTEFRYACPWDMKLQQIRESPTTEDVFYNISIYTHPWLWEKMFHIYYCIARGYFHPQPPSIIIIIVSWVLSVVNGLLGCCGEYLLSHEWSHPSCNPPPSSCIIINYLGHYFTMFPCMSARTIECANNACQCVVSVIIGICVIDLICRVDTINCTPALDSIPSPEITIVQAKRVQDNTSVPWLPKDARDDDLLNKHEGWGHYNGPGTIAHRTIGNSRTTRRTSLELLCHSRAYLGRIADWKGIHRRSWKEFQRRRRTAGDPFIYARQRRLFYFYEFC